MDRNTENRKDDEGDQRDLIVEIGDENVEEIPRSWSKMQLF